jgi:hypothetical protein
VSVSREWGREVVSRTTFLVVETRTSVLVDVMTERREPPVEVDSVCADCYAVAADRGAVRADDTVVILVVTGSVAVSKAEG